MIEINKTAFLAKVNATLSVDQIKKHLAEQGMSWNYLPTADSHLSLEHHFHHRTPNFFFWKHGSIEDLISGIKFELHSSNSIQLPLAPRSAIGPDFNRFMCGSLNQFGRIEHAHLRLSAPAETIQIFGVFFDDDEIPTQILRYIVGNNLPPLFFVWQNFPKKWPSNWIEKNSKSSAGRILFIGLSGLKSRVDIECKALGHWLNKKAFSYEHWTGPISFKTLNAMIFTKENLLNFCSQSLTTLWSHAPGWDNQSLKVSNQIDTTGINRK